MQLKFQKEILLTVKILIPVFGILFFNWSIGTIFLFFLLELLFIGGETILKIIFSGVSTVGQKAIGILRFSLIYSFLVFCIFVLVGNFFKGDGAGNMRADFQIEIIFLLIGIYLFDFFFGYLYSKKFKTASTKSLEKETYYQLIIYFFLLLMLLMILGFLTVSANFNFVLGIAIIITRNLAEYFLGRKTNVKNPERKTISY